MSKVLSLKKAKNIWLFIHLFVSLPANLQNLFEKDFLSYENNDYQWSESELAGHS
jgi:hypothetical protein